MVLYEVEMFETIRHVIQVEASDEQEAGDKATAFHCGTGSEVIAAGYTTKNQAQSNDIGMIESIEKPKPIIKTLGDFNE